VWLAQPPNARPAFRQLVAASLCQPLAEGAPWLEQCSAAERCRAHEVISRRGETRGRRARQTGSGLESRCLHLQKPSRGWGGWGWGGVWGGWGGWGGGCAPFGGRRHRSHRHAPKRQWFQNWRCRHCPPTPPCTAAQLASQEGPPSPGRGVWRAWRSTGSDAAIDARLNWA
jgi:hypothetical protein